ncbi:LOW QUALITY PROTEIN: opioid growth factor receptor-like [Lates calcarifer]|uniref:LOW QUALITY PROTEIN: opioid growth factor receptor-like n=1 Tax=Lates calcarifer TaxID=8187 RepID=A0AAJ7PPZ9_LATCA|nr:LOW QUALITY PROTEIN: opioid growth factor receptor-like [Lates calcarifer]
MYLQSLLCRLRRRVVLMMAWIDLSRVRYIIELLWRSSRGFFSCLTRVFTPIVRFVGRYAIVWREDCVNRGEPEITDENRLETSVSQQRVQESHSEGQYAAAVSNRRSEETEHTVDEFDSDEYRVETTDELYCGYDSTWEIEENQGNTFRSSRRPAASRSYKFSRFEKAARDMQNYRHDYPSQFRLQQWHQHMPSDDKPNLEFYLGRRPSSPDGIYIHHFHSQWKGDYDTLEYVHTYIQWLFPLQEPGMNNEARTLTKEEIQDFRNSSIAKENLLKSYELMLDFYGITLCDKKTGEVKRASNWRQRFNNLNNHTHNNLRITRILKCLGTLGYPHYQAPLVRFFLKETLIQGELPNIKDSVLSYFVFAVLDKKQRRNLIKFAYLNYEPKDEFVWCPRKIQMRWSGLLASNCKKGGCKVAPSPVCSYSDDED